MSDDKVQVGWYCHHGRGHYDRDKQAFVHDVPHREWRQKSDGTWKVKKRESVVSSMSGLDRFSPTDSACELAVPLYAPADSVAAQNLAADRL